MYFDQREYQIRFEWGLSGVEELAPLSDVVIIVDVLSFSTSVDIVVENGASVYPYHGDFEDLSTFAKERGALYAMLGRKQESGYSLSPSSLVSMPAGTRFVLPSPNGSRLSTATGDVCTMAGCLRNADSVAKRANALGKRISVIAAGERWQGGLLRPSLEDLLGAGAIIAHMSGSRSPEAEMAVAGFINAEPTLSDTLTRCGSGKELIDRGFSEDVALASQVNVSEVAPLLNNGAFA